MYYFLNLPSFALRTTMIEPRIPHTTPRVSAIGSIVQFGDFTTVLPNLSASVEIFAKLSLSLKSNVAYVRVNIQKVLAKKDLQTMGKVQNELGLEISYAKSAPPTGAPNAAETPADVPAAMK